MAMPAYKPLMDKLNPRVWWTKAEYQPFNPLFESRQAALAYYGITPIMSVVEQADACTGEG